MKRVDKEFVDVLGESPPHAGAWIETVKLTAENQHIPRSPPHAGAWIETDMPARTSESSQESPPHAGAWIETYFVTDIEEPHGAIKL